METKEQKSIVGTRWKKKPCPNPPVSVADIKDDMVQIRHESPLCITLVGLQTAETYYVGRSALFGYFTLLDECPKDGFTTSIGTMLI